MWRSVGVAWVRFLCALVSLYAFYLCFSLTETDPPKVSLRPCVVFLHQAHSFIHSFVGAVLFTGLIDYCAVVRNVIVLMFMMLMWGVCMAVLTIPVPLSSSTVSKNTNNQ